MKAASQGLSLIELMVSLTIVSLLFISIWRVFFYFQANYKRLERQLHESYEIQLVNTVIRDEIRRAGFTPCLPLNSLANEDKLQAYQIKPQTLTLSRMGEPFYSVKIKDLTHLMLDLNSEVGLSKRYLLADCYHAEQIQVAAISRSSGYQNLTLLHPLKFHYERPSYLGAWINETFYIREQQPPALMFKSNHAEMLTPEVKGLSVQEVLKGAQHFLDVQLQTEKGVHVMRVRVRGE